jgi:hypothetical protein
MTKAINQKVLSKSGRSLVKHGYWKTRTSEGVWDNGKEIGKHIYFHNSNPNVISEIILFTNTGDSQRILGIDYKNYWGKDVSWVSIYNTKSKANERIAWDYTSNGNKTNFHNLELVEELLDSNKEILMGYISAH